MRKNASPEDERSTLVSLSKLAYHGLVDESQLIRPRLVFDTSDFDKLETSIDEGRSDVFIHPFIHEWVRG